MAVVVFDSFYYTEAMVTRYTVALTSPRCWRLTLALTCGRKRERSGRWRQSGAVLCSAWVCVEGLVPLPDSSITALPGASFRHCRGRLAQKLVQEAIKLRGAFNEHVVVAPFVLLE